MTTILVVDDSPTMLSGTTKISASAGYDVIQAESGESGIKKAGTDKVWAQRQGASDYIVKPPNTKELLTNIESLINK